MTTTYSRFMINVDIVQEDVLRDILYILYNIHHTKYMYTGT